MAQEDPEKTDPETNKPLARPTLSSLEMLYRESWKEYHHTEYMVFIFLAAVAAADVALLQSGARSKLSPLALILATILGMFAVFVTWRQNQSRKSRMKIIEKVEGLLYLGHLTKGQERTAPRLGDSLLLLSILLFALPLLYLIITVIVRLCCICTGFAN